MKSGLIAQAMRRTDEGVFAMMWFLFFPLLMLPLAVIVLVCQSAGVGCGMHHGSGAYSTASQVPTGPDPVEIVRQRLARGEITPAEYEEIRRALG